MNSYVFNSEILEIVGREKKTWISGNNDRFNGLTFKDASIVSGSIHMLRPESIPLIPTPRINISIPMSYNFTERFAKCDFGPLDQGKCGSCWAFSVAKAFSHRYCRKHNVLRVFSPSNLVGCDRRNAGCNGGVLVPAWRYIDLRGLPLEECQPYNVNATSFNCSRKCFNQSIKYETNKTEYWSVFRYPSIPEMQLSIMTQGPLTTSMKVYSDFYYYKEGIYSHVKGSFMGYHAVEIIGWGVLKDLKYWIVSISWGTKWGMNGIFLIKRGVNECGIEDYVCAGIPI